MSQSSDYTTIKSSELLNARNSQSKRQKLQHCVDKVNDLISENNPLHIAEKPNPYEEIMHKIAANIENLRKPEAQTFATISSVHDNYVYYDLRRRKKYEMVQEVDKDITNGVEKFSESTPSTACVQEFEKRARFRKEAVKLTLIHMMLTQVRLAIQDCNPRGHIKSEHEKPLFNLENLPEEFIPRLLACRRKLRFLPNGDIVPAYPAPMDQPSYETFDEFLNSTTNDVE